MGRGKQERGFPEKARDVVRSDQFLERILSRLFIEETTRLLDNKQTAAEVTGLQGIVNVFKDRLSGIGTMGSVFRRADSGGIATSIPDYQTRLREVFERATEDIQELGTIGRAYRRAQRQKRQIQRRFQREMALEEGMDGREMRDFLRMCRLAGDEGIEGHGT